jgi:hypothetical protein
VIVVLDEEEMMSSVDRPPSRSGRVVAVPPTARRIIAGARRSLASDRSVC